MAIKNKTTLLAQFVAQRDLRAIGQADLEDFFESLECGAEYDLPDDGWAIAETVACTTSWAEMGLFSGATVTATPANGGYGLLPGRQAEPNETLFDSTLAIESAEADGWYKIVYAVSCEAVSAAVKIGIYKGSGSPQGVQRAFVGSPGTVPGHALVHLALGDVVRLVSRGQASTNLNVYSAQFTAKRWLAD